MGTSNFYNNNASRVFAISDSEIEDQWEWDDLIENIKCSFDSKGFDREDGYEGGLRSYPGTYIASKTVYKSFGELEVGIEIKAILRSGYYSGANIDWEVNYNLAGDSFSDEKPDKDDIIEAFWRYYDVKAGMATIQSKNIFKFYEKTEQELVNEVEAILTEVTEPLVVTARFSNGETWYAPADNKKAMLKAVANDHVI